jgi:hypothetical protein
MSMKPPLKFSWLQTCPTLQQSPILSVSRSHGQMIATILTAPEPSPWLGNLRQERMHGLLYRPKLLQRMSMCSRRKATAYYSVLVATEHPHHAQGIGLARTLSTPG